MTERKIDKILADYSMEIQKNLNRSLDPMNMKMWEKVKEARENNEETAKSQKNQAFFYKLGAIGALSSSILGGVFSIPDAKAFTIIASICNVTAQQASNATQIPLKGADADITHSSQETRINEFAQQRFSQIITDLTKRMSDLTDLLTRCISKQVIN